MALVSEIVQRRKSKVDRLRARRTMTHNRTWQTRKILPKETDSGKRN